MERKLHQTRELQWKPGQEPRKEGGGHGEEGGGGGGHKTGKGQGGR